MRSINKKGDAATSETPYVVLAVVLLVLGLSIFLIVKSNFLNDTSARETMCYFSNNLKSGGGAFALFPNLCSLEIVEYPVDTMEFSSLVRRSWWMYLQGTEDLGNAADEVFPIYQFTPSEDINLGKYFIYSLSYSNGVRQTDISKTDYAYLEKNTLGPTICFDKSGDGATINNYYLSQGETYYIMFYDDQAPHEMNDMILISPNPNFDAGYWKSFLLSYFAYTQFSGKVISTGLETFGEGSLSFYITNEVKDTNCLDYQSIYFGNPEGKA